MIFCLWLFSLPTVAAIKCFQCKSTEERTCGEELPQHHVLFADSCDHIQEAEYCVKMTGLVEGGAGTFVYQLSCYPAAAAGLHFALTRTQLPPWPSCAVLTITNIDFHSGAQHSRLVAAVSMVAATHLTNNNPAWLICWYAGYSFFSSLYILSWNLLLGHLSSFLFKPSLYTKVLRTEVNDGCVSACGLKCYQCDSSSDEHCPVHIRPRHHSPSILPTSCSRVFEARYCVKTTGMFAGLLLFLVTFFSLLSSFLYARPL